MPSLATLYKEHGVSGTQCTRLLEAVMPAASLDNGFEPARLVARWNYFTRDASTIVKLTLAEQVGTDLRSRVCNVNIL